MGKIPSTVQKVEIKGLPINFFQTKPIQGRTKCIVNLLYKKRRESKKDLLY